MVVTYTPEQEQQTKALLAKGDQLGKAAAAKTGVAYDPTYTPAPTPLVSSEGAVSATAITPAPQVNLPQPTAPAAQQQFQLGLETSATHARSTLDDVLKTQRDDAIKRQEDAASRLQKILSESDPQKRATYAQEQRIVQQQLDSAESASRTVTEDFESRRRIVGELETLLNDGNNLIKQQLGLPVGQRVVEKRASQALQDVQARGGVLQAVIAGLDGNIALAHTLIDTAGSAVRTQWQDQVAYNNAVLELAANKELAIDGEHKKYAEEQLGMAKSKLDGIEKTIARIKEAMIDPETARDFADAGITLNDSVQEINKKLGAQVQRREDKKVSETLAMDALQNGAPPAIAAQMRNAKTVDEALQLGGFYVGRLDRQHKTAQINKLGLENMIAQAELEDIQSGNLTEKQINALDNSPQGKKLQTAASLKLKLNSYQALVDQYGYQGFGSNKAKIQNAFTELQLAYKEAANLGVLNGPDLMLVEKAIKSATPGFWGNTGNIVTLGQGTRNLKANLEQAQQTLNDAAEYNLKQLYARDSDYETSFYVQSMMAPFGDELITDEEVADMDQVANQEQP